MREGVGFSRFLRWLNFFLKRGTSGESIYHSKKGNEHKKCYDNKKGCNFFSHGLVVYERILNMDPLVALCLVCLMFTRFN